MLLVGDQWISERTFTGIAGTNTTADITIELIGEELYDGKEGYLLQMSSEDQIFGGSFNGTIRIEKETMFPMMMYFSGTLMGVDFTEEATYTSEFLGKEELYPLVVGKELQVTETVQITETRNGSTEILPQILETYTYTIEGTEEVTVSAGSFWCYKITKTNETDEVISTFWVSDETKMWPVKSQGDDSSSWTGQQAR